MISVQLLNDSPNVGAISWTPSTRQKNCFNYRKRAEALQVPNRLPTSSNEKSLLLAARVVILDVDCCGIQCHDTVDGRNPKQPPSICKKSVNDGINYQPQLVIAGFLNHQQYVMLRCSFFFLELCHVPRCAHKFSKKPLAWRFEQSQTLYIEAWWIIY